MPMGLNCGDIDNHGFLDLYMGSGNSSSASPLPNVLHEIAAISKLYEQRESLVNSIVGLRCVNDALNHAAPGHAA